MSALWMRGPNTLNKSQVHNFKLFVLLSQSLKLNLQGGSIYYYFKFT